MKTDKIKTFAKQARIMLLEGVWNQLNYWGFDRDGNCNVQLIPVSGGYSFRGKVFNDALVPAKWARLKEKIHDKVSAADVVEETAYTWFNRLMAVKILEKNGYIQPHLQFAPDTRTPIVVQNAKNGKHGLKNTAYIDLLHEYLRQNNEEEAFGLLISRYCNNNQLLHDIFGRIDDYTEILLPQNLLQKDGVLDLINSDAISSDDYKEVELIGWLYQFYISDKKDEVFAGFKKNKKARAEDIPAATQIFTPKWIVKYMVENTVGKIYLDYEPTSSLKEDMKYLVHTSTELSTGNDSDKDNKAIISDITELTLIDPASGSGHILVTGFELLFKMYREEGYTAKQAVDNILEHNLFGLDIDDRAMQLARFAVLLKAAQFDADVLNRGIIPHVYSFPEGSHFTSEELQNFLGHDGHQYTAELKEALQLLNQGKNIGSALKLELSEEAQQDIKQRYADWLEKSKRAGLDIEQSSIWNRLHPFLDILLALSKKYASVVANPPYLALKNMNKSLRKYISDEYKMSKPDLAMVFVELIYKFSVPNGICSIINQWSWLCTSDFKELRKWFLSECKVNSELHLGIGVFDEMNSKKIQSTSISFRKSRAKDSDTAIFIKLDEVFNSSWKHEQFANKERWYEKKQSDFELIEGSPFTFWFNENSYSLYKEGQLLGDLLDPRQGMATTDNKRFLRLWHEINPAKIGFGLDRKTALESKFMWYPYNKGGGFKRWYGNNEYLVNFYKGGEELKSVVKEKYRNTSYAQGFSDEKWDKLIEVWVLKNQEYYFKKSITWGLIALRFTARHSPQGFIFDVGGSSGFPNDENYEYILGLLNTKVSSYYLNGLNYTLNIQVGDIKRIVFNDSKEKESIQTIVTNSINFSKKDWDSRETSWEFEKSPLINDSVSLSKAYETWFKKVSDDFFQLHANEEELNRIFIDIYGLQEELTPEVALKDITILQEELDRNALESLEPVFREQGKEAVSLPINKAEVISQFISYGIGVFIGRYRLDKPGLNIAHPNPTEEELSKYQYNGHKIEIDEDGILPLMGEDCAFPDDALVRTKDLVHAVWGEDSLTENINFIHDALGMDLHKWLTEKFWGYHTSMYKKKPIYWLFSSNVKKPQNAAFKVLVYMHRMDKYTVQKIQRNYLHPHQEYIKREIEKLTDNESNLGRLELKRLEKLRTWEIECRDYNEVLKEIANLQIEIDLDDGVDVNYAKFEGAVAKIG